VNADITIRSRLSVCKSIKYCSICGLPIPKEIVSMNHDLMGTVDHALPRFHGGRNVNSNRVPAHRVCNIRKGSRLFLPYDFIVTLQEHVSALLARLGKPVNHQQLREARQRINLPAANARLRGEPLSIQFWEDDGGAIARW
jgi:hypothetical protein